MTGTTRKEYVRKLDTIKSELLNLLDDAKTMLEYLFESIRSLHVPLEQATKLDREVRARTAQLLDLCTEVLTLQQPMASDLRMILSAIRIKTDVERVVRDSLHIIELQLAEPLKEADDLRIPLEQLESTLFEMIEILKRGIKENNAEILLQLSEKDEIVDTYYAETTKKLREYIIEHADQANEYLDLILSSRMVERIADHLCNIGEKAYYMITAENIRIA